MRGRGAVERVRKRDGRLVPFQVSKIRDAMAAALEAVGESDAEFATEVARVVELTLEDKARASAREGGRAFVPDIEEIQDLVERALMELGRPKVAKAYILYRDRRARIREALRVHRADSLRAPVRVREAEGVSPWSKGRIVAALIDEAELPREAAEDVAAAVERRVFDSGLKRITTGLVRELVAGELFERGFTHAIGLLGVVGLSRHDLRAALHAGSVAAGRGASGAWSGSPPQSPSAAGSWRGTCCGASRSKMSSPRGPASCTAPAIFSSKTWRRCISRSPSVSTRASCLRAANSVSGAFAVLEGAADLAQRVSRTLVLERPAAVLSPLARATRPKSPLGLAGWLRGLAAVSRASGVRIVLGSSGVRFSALAARLVEELVEMAPNEHNPALILEGHELEGLLASHAELAPLIDRLFAEGRLLSSWGDGVEDFAGPGCHRQEKEPGLVSCGGAIALNLPRLARRAGAWREELVFSGLADLVHAALEVARALESFQTAHDAIRASGLHARRSYAIVPVGLREALLHLGDGTIDPDQGARMLGLIADASRRFAVAHSHIVAPCPFFGERAAQRFARSRSTPAGRWGGATLALHRCFRFRRAKNRRRVPTRPICGFPQ